MRAGGSTKVEDLVIGGVKSANGMLNKVIVNLSGKFTCAKSRGGKLKWQFTGRFKLENEDIDFNPSDEAGFTLEGLPRDVLTLGGWGLVQVRAIDEYKVIFTGDKEIRSSGICGE